MKNMQFLFLWIKHSPDGQSIVLNVKKFDSWTHFGHNSYSTRESKISETFYSQKVKGRLHFDVMSCGGVLKFRTTTSSAAELR